MFSRWMNRFRRENSNFKSYTEVRSLAEAYVVAVNNVINDHREVVTEDGKETWQSNPFVICVNQPWYKDYIHINSPYGEKFYKEYANDLVNGKDSNFVYDYHTRLFHYQKHYYDDLINEYVPNDIYSMIMDCKIDQINYCIEKLNEEPNTRRAVSITWQPIVDHIHKDVPCLQFVQFWIENNKLNAYFLMRSNDVLLAFPANIYGFFKLQQYVKSKLDGIGLGRLYISEVCPHLYNKRDANELAKWTVNTKVKHVSICKMIMSLFKRFQ